MYRSAEPSGGLGQWMGVRQCADDLEFRALYPAACPGYQETAPDTDLVVQAAGPEPAPSPEPADGGELATTIEQGLPGDLVARVGLPRQVAPWIIGVAVAIGLAQAVRFAAEA